MHRQQALVEDVNGHLCTCKCGYAQDAEERTHQTTAFLIRRRRSWEVPCAARFERPFSVFVCNVAALCSFELCSAGLQGFAGNTQCIGNTSEKSGAQQTGQYQLQRRHICP